MIGYAVRNDAKSSTYKEGGCIYAVYLHGKIEEINGYDCICLLELPADDGIYTIEVILSDGTSYFCDMYFWYWQGIPKGLIVLKGDTAGEKFAKFKYNKKCVNLSLTQDEVDEYGDDW